MNPNLPILCREAQGIEPKLWARFGITIISIYFNFYINCFLCFAEFGRESNASLSGLNAEQVLQQIEKITKD
jgi:hypothetical protein